MADNLKIKAELNSIINDYKKYCNKLNVIKNDLNNISKNSATVQRTVKIFDDICNNNNLNGSFKSLIADMENFTSLISEDSVG